MLNPLHERHSICISSERESRNFESFVFACSIARATWFACSIKVWFVATSINNFLVITNYFKHDFNNFLPIVLTKGVLFLALFWLFGFLETKLCLKDGLYYLKRWLNMAYDGFIHVEECLLLRLIWKMMQVFCEEIMALCQVGGDFFGCSLWLFKKKRLDQL